MRALLLVAEHGGDTMLTWIGIMLAGAVTSSSFSQALGCGARQRILSECEHDLLDQGREAVLRYLPEEIFDARAIDPYTFVEALFRFCGGTAELEAGGKLPQKAFWQMPGLSRPASSLTGQFRW